MSEPTPEDNEFEPVARNKRFIVRLVMLLVVGGIAGVYLGGKIQRGASSCGSNLLRPGSTVIPPSPDASASVPP